MTAKKDMHDLFFEVSHEDRYGILQILQKKAMRITDIAKELNINNPEARRHLSRLSEVGLVHRDVEGLYNLSSYGEACLLLFSEFDFLSTNRDYFGTHSLSRIPVQFLKRVGELLETKSLLSALDFFRHTENLFRESRSYVWLLVDQFPMNSISSIMDSIERGVKYRIIEPRDRVLDTDYDALSSEETRAISRTRGTPLIEQRMVDEINICMFISDSNCVFAFPTSDGKYDYIGFSGTDELTLNWCKELYKYYWDESESRKPKSLIQIERGRISTGILSKSVVVQGKDNPKIDAQAVQDAVDNYDEVLLRGLFNFGSSQVRLSKSVIVKGEGRESGIPKTTIYKKGWMFPFREWDYLFLVNGEGADVRIENLHCTDFNCSCIGGRHGNSLSIVDNRITIPTGYGRGMTYGAFGDIVLGIQVEAAHSFRGGVVVEGNYLDFAPGPIWGGHVSRGGLEEDPEYRPDLFNHEYYFSYGIAVNSVSGEVRIENNIVRNINGRGIATEGHLASTNAIIRRNTVVSDVYGSYPFLSNEAGAGILAQSVLSTSGPGFNVEIEDNTIKLDKPNYSGIVALGPATSREGAEKLTGGTIRNNIIQLKDGYEGIHVRKCDKFEVSENKISGEAYYGIRVSGRRKAGERDQRALNNLVEGNDMDDLRIREPDEYSDNHADGRRFAVSHTESSTAHVWLDKFSANNVIKICKDEKVIDDGEDNAIEDS